MSLRYTELGINLSREACGPATKDFCPAASASILIACGQATATFCPTASASGMLHNRAVEFDFEPLRAQMRTRMREN